jgi:hypothetical protein
MRQTALARAATNIFPPGGGLAVMLREDPNGDFIGEYTFKGRAYQYRVRGYGKPVLITASMSPRSDSYTWRYLFECLAGTYFVYSLDIESLYRDAERVGSLHYAKLIEAFLRDVIGVRSSIVSGDKEYVAVRTAAFEARALVDRIVFLCPGGVGGYRLRGSIVARNISEIVGVPKPGKLRRMTEGSGVCNTRWLRSGAMPGDKSPIRICEDIMQLLG